MDRRRLCAHLQPVPTQTDALERINNREMMQSPRFAYKWSASCEIVVYFHMHFEFGQLQNAFHNFGGRNNSVSTENGKPIDFESMNIFCEICRPTKME